MNTEVIMKRELFGCEIRQKSKNSFFCASDLVNAGNKWRVTNGKKVFNYSQWIKNETTQEFIKEMEKEYGKVIIKGKSKNSPSWIHPFLFIDLALAISPELKIKTYKWLYDCLVEYRNKSGDSYKKMCGALYLTQGNKTKFQKDIQDFANKIKVECGVDDWEAATEEQLKLRNKIHENISLLSDIIKDRGQLFELSVKKAREAREAK